jgi:SAM-dependent methyltransferase
VERDELQRFYDECYSAGGEEGELYGRWRRHSAEGKADHVVALARREGGPLARVVDVGCGDGALLDELARRGVGAVRDGFEITDAAVALARERPGVSSARTFDGARLPVADGDYDLAILSHVLEHVHDPAGVLAEAMRVARCTVVEVPLEANLSARRPGKRAHAEEIGHLHAFSRAAMRGIVARAGCRVGAELVDPLPRSVHTFFAADTRARVKGTVKWAGRRALTAVPAVAERVITLHYAALVVRR